jgi:hypothetical protein
MYVAKYPFKQVLNTQDFENAFYPYLEFIQGYVTKPKYFVKLEM